MTNLRAFRESQYPTLPLTAEITLDHFHQVHRDPARTPQPRAPAQRVHHAGRRRRGP